MIVVLGLTITLVPASLLGAASIKNLHVPENGIADGSIKLPPPPKGIADWPFIGTELDAFWSLASTHLQDALIEVEPQAQALGKSLLRASAAASMAVLQFAAAIIIAGLFFGSGKSLVAALRAFEARLIAKRGRRLVDLANATVQNVARGVFGVALLQTVLASVGYLAVNYPFGAALTVVVLLLSILNLGPTLPVFLSIAYGWTFLDTVPVILFTVYMIPVGLLDNFLRPIIVARGLPVPMAVMFIGVVGGALTGGLLGLFIGPIVLVVGYQLFSAWIAGAGKDAAPAEAPAEGDG